MNAKAPLLVCLDTCSIIDKYYHFSGSSLSRFQDKIAEGLIRVVLPGLCLTEIHKNLDTEADKAKAAIDRFKKNSRFTTLHPSEEVRDKLHFIDKDVVDQTKKDVHARLANFLSLPSVTVIHTNASVMDSVLDRYFAKKPPFTNGKSEFPDAIWLESVRAYMAKNKINTLLVVSNDGEVEKYCKEMDGWSCVKTVDDVIERVLQRQDEDVQFFRGLLFKKTFEIENALINRFSDIDFKFDLFGPEGIELRGYVGDAKIVNLDVSPSRIRLVGIDRDNLLVTGSVAVTFEGSLSIDFEGVDPDGDWYEASAEIDDAKTVEEVPVSFSVSRKQLESTGQLFLENLIINDESDDLVWYHDSTYDFT
ncbi:MAG: DUF4935 domain-containing protein [Phycisphaerales bacterium]|nr:DUF4935 domain-containing protein [Phycisphaerales bacterium]